MSEEPTSDESQAEPPEPAPASEPDPEPTWPDVTKIETRSLDPDDTPNRIER
jgi:hypothetical protein